jgi:hypothetical protein
MQTIKLFFSFFAILFLVEGNCITVKKGTYTLCTFVIKGKKNPEILLNFKSMSELKLILEGEKSKDLMNQNLQDPYMVEFKLTDNFDFIHDIKASLVNFKKCEINQKPVFKVLNDFKIIN